MNCHNPLHGLEGDSGRLITHLSFFIHYFNTTRHQSPPQTDAHIVSRPTFHYNSLKLYGDIEYITPSLMKRHLVPRQPCQTNRWSTKLWKDGGEVLHYNDHDGTSILHPSFIAFFWFISDYWELHKRQNMGCTGVHDPELGWLGFDTSRHGYASNGGPVEWNRPWEERKKKQEAMRNLHSMYNDAFKFLYERNEKGFWWEDMDERSRRTERQITPFANLSLALHELSR